MEAQTKLSELTAKQQHDLNIVEQLKTIVSDKELKVKVLENEIQQLKLAVSILNLRGTNILKDSFCDFSCLSYKPNPCGKKERIYLPRSQFCPVRVAQNYF